MKLSAAFFDIDDTILNHTESMAKAVSVVRLKFFPKVKDSEFQKVWFEVSDKYWAQYTKKKISFDEQRVKRMLDIWKHYGKEISEDEARKVFQVYLDSYEKFWRSMEFAEDIFKLLHSAKVKLGVITNGNKNQQIRKIEFMKIRKYIDNRLMIFSEEIGFAKPDPRIFKHAQKLANSNSGETLMVGNDYDFDIVPSKNLGWKTFHVNENQNLKKLSDIIFR